MSTRAPRPSNPMQCARYLAKSIMQDGTHTIRRWKGDWYEFVGTHWTKIDGETVKAWAYSETEKWKYPDSNAPSGERDWNPDKRRVGELLSAFAAFGLIQESTAIGDWLDGTQLPDRLIPMQNGLLNPTTRELQSSNAQFFTTWSLPYSFDPSAMEPTEWLKFLNSTLPGRQEEIDLLQEWMGYLVSGRTDMQKALLLKGEKRSGKGTIIRICEAIVGRANTVGTSFSDMGGPFGLENALDKTLITIGDSKNDRPNKDAIERIMSITGCDTVTVNIKNKKAITTRLGGRLMIAANAGLNLLDASGAAASRFIVLTFKESFFGKEDLSLGDRLEKELPAIMKWALDGLDRLNRNGYFTMSADSEREREEMVEEGSPVTMFVQETCVTGPQYQISRAVLFTAYRLWCEQYGYGMMNDASFGRAFKVCGTKTEVFKPRVEGRQIRAYKGIALDPVWYKRITEEDYKISQDIIKQAKAMHTVKKGD